MIRIMKNPKRPLMQREFGTKEKTRWENRAELGSEVARDLVDDTGRGRGDR
jgi:hypothetical protein